MIELPENWNEMNRHEKDLWFARNACFYSHEGEIGGLLQDVSDGVRKAWEEFCEAEK